MYERSLDHRGPVLVSVLVHWQVADCAFRSWRPGRRWVSGHLIWEGASSSLTPSLSLSSCLEISSFLPCMSVLDPASLHWAHWKLSQIETSSFKFQVLGILSFVPAMQSIKSAIFFSLCRLIIYLSLSISKQPLYKPFPLSCNAFSVLSRKEFTLKI